MFNHCPVEPISNITSKTVKNQRWYTTPNGIQYPSITTVLGADEAKKSGIEAWKQALGKDKSSKEQKRCADRGTAVHLIIEKFLHNQPDYNANVPFEYEKVFNNMQLRLKKIDNINAIELPLYSDNIKVAGCVDCVAEYNGVPSIIDFKTSTNVKNEQIIQDYFLQCTAYAIMFDEHYKMGIDNLVIIIGCETGLPKVFVRSINNYIQPLLQRISRFYAK